MCAAQPGKPGKEEVMVSVVCKTTLSTTTIVTMEIEGTPYKQGRRPSWQSMRRTFQSPDRLS